MEEKNTAKTTLEMFRTVQNHALFIASILDGTYGEEMRLRAQIEVGREDNQALRDFFISDDWEVIMKDYSK